MLEYLAAILTLLSIAASIFVWLKLFKRWKIDSYLNEVKLPLVLWIIFGTLDVTITSFGVYYNPMREGNPAARWFFLNFGLLGGAIASILWISLWASVLAFVFKFIGKRNRTIALFIALALLYNLFLSHLVGFMTWQRTWSQPILSSLSQYGSLFPNSVVDGILPLRWEKILPGMAFALVHMGLTGRFGKKKSNQ